MVRSIVLSVLLALAAGCAATPAAHRVAASTSGRGISEELDCMSECLESGDEDCESCARQCLHPVSEPAAAVASIR